MPSFQTERRVEHPASEMFALVADVEAYPRFVPLCESLVVRGRRREDGSEILVADMTIAYRPFHETLTTAVTLDREAMTIRMVDVAGPFRRLDGRWSFAPEGDTACRVRFSIEYEFRSRVLATVAGSIFAQAVRRYVTAFEARADALHGA